MLVVAAGVRSGRRAPPAAPVRDAGWTVLDAAAPAGFAAPAVFYQHAEGVVVAEPGVVPLTAATGGAAAGVVAGRLEARAVWRTRERRASRARVEAGRDRFCSLFANLPHPAVRYELDGGVPEVRDANPAFERTFGEAPAGRPVEAFVRPAADESDDALAAAFGQPGALTGRRGPWR